MKQRTSYGLIPWEMTEERDFETGLSPERLELLAEQAYARGHASPLCGFEVPAASLPLRPAVQARAVAGRWTGAHSRSPFATPGEN